MQQVNNLTVQRVKGNNKALQLSDNEWYSTYSAMENPPAVGATVSFEYDTKDYNGTTFRNIKSSIQVSQSAPAQASSPASNTGSSGGGNGGDDVRQKSIIRQNAMRHAVPLVEMSVGTVKLETMTVEEVTDIALRCAAQIEEFTSGREDVAPLASPPDFDDAIPPEFQG